ncbi:MAG: hypothetical protein V4463_07830 [Pseudomonadota bacterium]
MRRRAVLAPSLRQLMTELRCAGASYHRIAFTLNRVGIPGHSGGRWFAATVRNLMLASPTSPNPIPEETPCSD